MGIMTHSKEACRGKVVFQKETEVLPNGYTLAKTASDGSNFMPNEVIGAGTPMVLMSKGVVAPLRGTTVPSGKKLLGLLVRPVTAEVNTTCAIIVCGIAVECNIEQEIPAAIKTKLPKITFI